MSARAPCLVVCELGAPHGVELATVEALARLVLEARRLGLELRLRGVSDELVELIELAGLRRITAY